MIATLAIALAATVPAATAPLPAPSPAPNATRSAETRYCVKSTPTGSILPVRECRTRAEWLRDGVDPTAKK